MSSINEGAKRNDNKNTLQNLPFIQFAASVKECFKTVIVINERRRSTNMYLTKTREMERGRGGERREEKEPELRSTRTSLLWRLAGGAAVAELIFLFQKFVVLFPFPKNWILPILDKWGREGWKNLNYVLWWQGYRGGALEWRRIFTSLFFSPNQNPTNFSWDMDFWSNPSRLY